MKILVTGASGFLGGRLCDALLRQGYSVRVLVRSTSDISSLSPHIEIFHGDITDYASILAACSSCTIVFHLAALVEPWLPDPSKFFSVSSPNSRSSITEPQFSIALLIFIRSTLEDWKTCWRRWRRLARWRNSCIRRRFSPSDQLTEALRTRIKCNSESSRCCVLCIYLFIAFWYSEVRFWFRLQL